MFELGIYPRLHVGSLRRLGNGPEHRSTIAGGWVGGSKIQPWRISALLRRM